MAKGREFQGPAALEEARIKQGETEGPQDYEPFDPNDPRQVAARAEAERQSRYPTPTKKLGAGEVDPQQTAQYAEEEMRRRRLAIAHHLLDQEIAKGAVPVEDEDAKMDMLDKILVRLERHEEQQKSAAELGRLAALPGREPEEVKYEPATPEELAMSKGLSRYMSKTLQNVARRRREEEELPALQKSAEELSDIKRKRTRLQALRQLVTRSDVPEETRSDYRAEIKDLEKELEETPGLPAVGKSIIDDASLRRLGSRPGWTIMITQRYNNDGKALPGKFMIRRRMSPAAEKEKIESELQDRIKKGKIDPANTELIDSMRQRIRRDVRAKQELQIANDEENEGLQGQRLAMMFSLDADNRFTVGVYRGEKGYVAIGRGPNKEYDEMLAAGHRPKMPRLASGHPEDCQKKLEDIAKSRGVKLTDEAPPEPSLERKGLEAPSAGLTPEPSTEESIEDYAPEGGWKPATDEVNDMVLADDEEDEEKYRRLMRALVTRRNKLSSLPKHSPTREKGLKEVEADIKNLSTSYGDVPAIHWGDYWRSKTPEEIAADPTDPREIDPRMADDRGLSEDQYIELSKKIALGQRFRKAEAFIPPKFVGLSAENEAELEDVRQRISDREKQGFKDASKDDILKQLKNREQSLLRRQKEIESGTLDRGEERPKYPETLTTGKDKVITVTDYDELGRPVKRKYTVYAWENPPYDSVVHPEMAKHRDKIRLMIPYLKAYFEQLKQFSDQALKPKNVNVVGWHKEFDRFGRETDVHITSDVVEPDAPCSTCGHPAESHEGWPNSAFECNHKDCQYSKKTRTGTYQASHCPRYKASKIKSDYKPKKTRHGELSTATIDALLHELWKLPSTWTSAKTSKEDLPPVTPQAIANEPDMQKALELQKAVARWYTSFNPEKIGIMPAEHKTLRPVPPHSREKIEKAKEAGEPTDKMFKENEEWLKRMQARAKINHTLLDNVKIISNWAEKARKNWWRDFRAAMIEKFRQDIFADSYPDMLATQKKFVNNNVFGPTKGVGPMDLGNAPPGRRPRRATFADVKAGELPYEKKFHELRKKADIDKVLVKRGEKPAMKKWERDDWYGCVMAKKRGWEPHQLAQVLDDMKLAYEKGSDNISDRTILGLAIIQFINRLARALAHSGGWGQRADEETMERLGSTVRNLGVDYPKPRDKSSKSPRKVAPQPPEHVSAADAEARKAKDRATRPWGSATRGTKDVEQAQHDVKMAGIERQDIFMGVPKTAGDKPFVPPKLAAEPAALQDPTEIESYLSSEQASEDELRQMGLDPEHFYSDIEGTDVDKGRRDELFTRQLQRIAEHATADRQPQWYDDI